MSKYSYLVEQFNNMLGDNYRIVYNNDEEIEWKDILLDNMIYGVMHTNSGTFDKMNGISVANQQLSINFIVPSAPEVFSEAIQTIEDTFKALHNSVYEYDSEMMRLMYGYITDATKTRINGVDYASIFIYLNLFTFENAVMGNAATITIDNIEMTGIIKASFTNVHTTDGVVKGLISPVQTNRLNGIQKTLIVDCVMVANDPLLIKLLNEEDSNISYNIKYNNGIKVRSNNMYLIQLTDSLIVNDTAKVQFMFGIK